MFKGFLLFSVSAIIAIILYSACCQSLPMYNAWVSITSHEVDINGYPIPSAKTKLWGLVNHPTAAKILYYGAEIGMGVGVLLMIVGFITGKLSSEEEDVQPTPKVEPGERDQNGKRIITEG